MGSPERVAEFLSKSGAGYEVREFDGSTRTSALAAQVLGCGISEIAKSVVFVGRGATVVVASGDKKVSLIKLAEVVGECRVATAEEVRVATGYPVGGVPPFPHDHGVKVLPDESLERFQAVWAAAGSPNRVFRMAPADIIRLVGAGPFDLCE